MVFAIVTHNLGEDFMPTWSFVWSCHLGFVDDKRTDSWLIFFLEGQGGFLNVPVSQGL